MMPCCLEIVGLEGKIVELNVVVCEQFGSMHRATTSVWKPEKPREILVGLVNEPIPGPRDWSPRAKKKDYEAICVAPFGSAVILQSLNDRGVVQEIRIDLVRCDAEVAVLNRDKLVYR